jgi:cellulose synthase/poly-beta-1,6-N-acetylglucosamine synthase-like glycosyltransferase
MPHLLYLLLGLTLVIVTLPLVLELTLVTAASLLPARKRARELPASGFPLAVVIPAHNEEFLIARCVRSVRESAAHSLGNSEVRVFVVAHNCADRTAEQANEAGAEVLVYNDLAARGKGFALRHGFDYALANSAAQAVLVIDADSIVSDNLIPAVQNLLASGADAVQCRYEMESATDKPNGRLAALALRGFNVIRPRGRERLGLSAGIFGNGFALTRNLLREVPYGAFSVVEDLEYHISLVLAKKRVRFLESALVSATLPASQQGEQVQRSRWEGGRFHVARNQVGPLFGKLLRGRLRLFEPLVDLAGLPMAYGVFALLLALCIPVAGIRIYALASLLVVAAHVVIAAASGPDFLRTLGLLALAPFYIAWKLRLLPSILRGSKGKAAWVRTNRDSNFRSIS